MPCIRRRAVVSFWAVLLLVLAASPLTAPFSSCSPLDLFADRELQDGALLQAKTVKDHSTATTGSAPMLLCAGSETYVSLIGRPLPAHRHCTLQIPLRL